MTAPRPAARAAATLLFALLTVAALQAHGQTQQEVMEVRCTLDLTLECALEAPLSVFTEALGLPPMERPTAAELEALAGVLNRALPPTFPVMRDGMAITPQWAGARLTLPEPPEGTPPARLEVSQGPEARLSVTLQHGLGDHAREVTILWGLLGVFPEGEPADAPGPAKVVVPVTLQVKGEDAPRRFHFARRALRYTWHRPTPAPDFPVVIRPRGLSVPMLSAIFLLLAGGMWVWSWWGSPSESTRRKMAVAAVGLIFAAGAASIGFQVEVPLGVHPDPLPTPDQARDIFRALHLRVYEAFDRRTEDEIYDALADCAQGELLERLYKDIYASLLLKLDDGTEAHTQIQAVDITQVQLTSPPRVEGETISFEVQSRWQVAGEVIHWQHQHRRVNAYEARWRVRWAQGQWHLVGLDVEGQRRIDEPSGEALLERARQRRGPSPGALFDQLRGGGAP